MNKKNKYILTMMFIIFVLSILFVPKVFASNEPLAPWIEPGQNGVTKVDSIAKRVWPTILRVVQIAAFSGLIIAGIRYMFASATDKADIKKSMLILVTGLAIVFGASVLVEIIYNITKEALI